MCTLCSLYIDIDDHAIQMSIGMIMAKTHGQVKGLKMVTMRNGKQSYMTWKFGINRKRLQINCSLGICSKTTDVECNEQECPLGQEMEVSDG